MFQLEEASLLQKCPNHICTDTLIYTWKQLRATIGYQPLGISTRPAGAIWALLKGTSVRKCCLFLHFSCWSLDLINDLLVTSLVSKLVWFIVCWKTIDGEVEQKIEWSFGSICDRLVHHQPFTGTVNMETGRLVSFKHDCVLFVTPKNLPEPMTAPFYFLM